VTGPEVFMWSYLPGPRLGRHRFSHKATNDAHIGRIR